MNVSLELLSSNLSDFILEELTLKKFNAKKLVDTKATQILQEIQNVLAKENLSDFELVEEIVCIFEKNNLSIGGCHDFG